MFGKISGFFSVRHICNAREAEAQTGPYDVGAQNSRNWRPVLDLRAANGCSIRSIMSARHGY
jgi:hypothetical protein